MHSDSDFAEIQTINLHNNLYGRITSIGVSFDHRFVISVGLDCNIFTFQLNSSMHATKQSEKITNFVEPLPCADIHDPQHLSLEEQKKQNHRDERIHLINKKKSQMLEVLAMLKEDFSSVKNRNDALPESQRLAASEMVLDNRISDDMARGFAREMEFMRSKMAFEVEKTKLLKHKVETLMISNLEGWPIMIRGIRYGHTDSRVEMIYFIQIFDF